MLNHYHYERLDSGTGPGPGSRSRSGSQSGSGSSTLRTTTNLDLPAHPPQYKDIGNGNGFDNDNNIDSALYHASASLDSDPTGLPGSSSSSSSSRMLQFEIDEPQPEQTFINRAQSFSKKFANNFQTRILYPVSKMIDPIYEGYKFLQLHYEKLILKLGNPLVVKRLLYVLIMMLVIFGISRYTANEYFSGPASSGGAFSSGQYDLTEKIMAEVAEMIDAKSMKEHLEYFSSVPHISGSKGDLLLAKYTELFMKTNGLQNVGLNEFSTFLNYPSSENTYIRLLDGSFTAKLYEKDNQGMESLAYNQNVLNNVEVIKTQYVYANYGSHQDFENLQKHGVDINGKIVLVKYGGSTPEPKKIFFAQQHSAKAVIFITPQVEPTGDAIQKDSIAFTRLVTGDSQGFGWPTNEDGYVTKLSWEMSEIVPKIVSIPISWRDGEKLIKKLTDGYKFDDGFSGTGKNGGDSFTLEMKVDNIDRPHHPIWNVMGSINGRGIGEQGVIIGAQRDAACYGTVGSSTGMAAFLELIKILTTLQRKYQWAPSRPIYFISFDATDYNLAGSTKWIESRKDALRQDGFLYIDMSDLVSGDELQVNMHSSMKKIVHDALKKVSTGGESLLKVIENQKKPNLENNFLETKNYMPFINLVKIPALEVKYKGKTYPKNSCYDDFENFEKSNIDKLMLKHSQLVELLSYIILDFVETPIAPYDYVPL